MDVRLCTNVALVVIRGHTDSGVAFDRETAEWAGIRVRKWQEFEVCRKVPKCAKKC